MKRSAQVTLTVVATLGLAACNRQRQDPCESGTFNEQACQQAVSSGGYYWNGAWFPMRYHYPYPYYYDSYRSYVSRGGAVRAAPAESYSRFGFARRNARRLRVYRRGPLGGGVNQCDESQRIRAPDWQQKVGANGLTWHTGEQPYWNESAFYEFTAKEVDVLEAATNELEKMTLQAAQHVIDNKLYSQLGDSGDARSR